jgi:hypothetical protein
MLGRRSAFHVKMIQPKRPREIETGGFLLLKILKMRGLPDKP